MKKITYILSAVACLAALLTSCVKEESYTREVAELNIDLTPIEENGSVVQGDAITDAMIWAFQCTLNDTTGAPTIDDGATAVGARYVYDLNTYGSISVHVPLPICNGSQDYLLVAVINTQAYGNFALTSDSTWGAIKAATFDSTGAFWSTYPNDIGMTPEVMPISNWTTFTITSDNTHDDNCYQLNLPVYRTVSKAQFLVAKATDDFDLDILDVKVVANRGYSTGALLTANPETADGDNSEKIQRGKPDATATTWWWASPTAVTRAEGATAPAITYQLKNSDSGFSPVNDVTTEVSADDHGDDATYAWIGSTFLFENNNDAAYGETGCYDAAQGDGYNLYVKYSVNGEEHEVYTPLGKVVRNHDYQVRALVEAGGKLSLDLVVNEWKEDEATYNYTEQVTVEGENQLKWTAKASESLANGVNTVTLAAAYADNSTPYAVCEFYISTPDDAEWHAAFVEGAINAFEFVDAGGNGVSTISGAVGAKNENGQPIKSTIKIRAKQATVPSNTEAFLSIVVVTPDGRTLPTDVLTGGVRQKILQTGSLSQN
ncbi:MAG: hypothetical protein IJB87_02415 [Alistipes sp.]|nr:hypothetical protein [Alistipes sp.]